MLKQIINSQGYAIGWEEAPEAPAAGTLHIAPKAPAEKAAANKKKG